MGFGGCETSQHFSMEEQSLALIIPSCRREKMKRKPHPWTLSLYEIVIPSIKNVGQTLLCNTTRAVPSSSVRKQDACGQGGKASEQRYLKCWSSDPTSLQSQVLHLIWLLVVNITIIARFIKWIMGMKKRSTERQCSWSWMYRWY